MPAHVEGHLPEIRAHLVVTLDPEGRTGDARDAVLDGRERLHRVDGASSRPLLRRRAQHVEGRHPGAVDDGVPPAPGVSRAHGPDCVVRRRDEDHVRGVDGGLGLVVCAGSGNQPRQLLSGREGSACRGAHVVPLAGQRRRHGPAYDSGAQEPYPRRPARGWGALFRSGSCCRRTKRPPSRVGKARPVGHGVGARGARPAAQSERPNAHRSRGIGCTHRIAQSPAA